MYLVELNCRNSHSFDSFLYFPFPFLPYFQGVESACC
uniref:Uncharacterized protein n=1 Tax=Utricularia reniformis TaxID=192314 RepID=A0A1Y0AZQ7_9LAMI|nr:hypothetical protein AEK19_MT0352 [Utricularia reniformis]ART30624.1 hypothetical protein AEK19_MT0352 [Utricularia reniformis]